MSWPPSLGFPQTSSAGLTQSRVELSRLTALVLVVICSCGSKVPSYFGTSGILNYYARNIMPILRLAVLSYDSVEPSNITLRWIYALQY